MRLELTGRHIDITPALRRLVDRKLARLERMLNDTAVSAQVVLSEEKYVRRADVSLHARGEKFLHGLGASRTWEASVTQAVGRIAQQAQKVKGKWQERKRHGKKPPVSSETRAGARVAVRVKLVRPRVVGSATPEMRNLPRIVRTPRQTIKTMSVAAAARQVELIGEDVLVFRDVDTAAISVIYKRASGDIALVATET